MKPRPILSVAATLLRSHHGRAPEGVSLRDMGDRLGVSGEFVRALLAGEKPPGLDLAVIIEDAYGIAPRDWTRRAKADCQLAVDEAALLAGPGTLTIESEAAQ